MSEPSIIPEHLLTPGEVARLFKVDPKTVTRWARAGRIRAIKTPGGHRRFYASDVEALLAGKRIMYERPATPRNVDRENGRRD